ncbi:hypothetical protein NUW54_g484 [Trametes sanguinea]|uniref:Uncharacterized protein n=1 Tax=Trametes sanguinea TaxID=158606 RepID=A0ACC1QAW6_9APHY|nr:hypothetical protein NUW54_g484 [Trametes sanguinea]
MRAHFGLPSVRGEHESLDKRAPITVKFEIPYFTVSGIQVRYLKIVEKSGYQALPWFADGAGEGQRTDCAYVRTWRSRGAGGNMARLEDSTTTRCMPWYRSELFWTCHQRDARYHWREIPSGPETMHHPLGYDYVTRMTIVTKTLTSTTNMSCGTVEASSGNPPWYVMDEDGQIMPLEVPARLKSHPEVIRRGLEPVDPFKIGVVYRTSALKEPQYYIKIVDTSTQEAEVYKRLSQCLATPNHTVPGEPTPPEAGHPLLITPDLSDFEMYITMVSSLSETLAFFYQMLEGIEYRHSMNIAHMDVCSSNIVTASLRTDQPCPNVEPGKLYFIDFGSSLQLPLGPGVQGAIPLPPSQYGLVYGIKHFDPYSWDIYCAALTMRQTLEARAPAAAVDIPHAAVYWLVGREGTRMPRGLSLLSYSPTGTPGPGRVAVGNQHLGVLPESAASRSGTSTAAVSGLI